MLTTTEPKVSPRPTGVARRVYFLHVPKAGGTTLNRYLWQHVHQDRIARATDVLNPAREQLSGGRAMDVREIVARYDCVSGHNCVDNLLPGEFLRMTVVREPVARLESRANHWRTLTDAELNAYPMEEERKAAFRAFRQMTTEQMLARTDVKNIRSELYDAMTKAFVARVPPARRHDELSAEQMVGEALDRLARTPVVGLQERYDDALRLISFHTGWPPPTGLERHNVRRGGQGVRHSPSPAVEAAIRLDRPVYELGRRLFEEQWAFMLDALGLPGNADGGAVDRALVGDVTRRFANTRGERPRQVRLGMLEALRGAGWHEREGLDVGRPYRWTGPAHEATAEFLIAPGDGYRVELDVVSVIRKRNLNDAVIEINGVPMRGQRRVQGDGHDVIVAEVGGRPVGDDGFCRVKVWVPALTSHLSVLPGCGDRRLKGLAVSEIRVSAL